MADQIDPVEAYLASVDAAIPGSPDFDRRLDGVSALGSSAIREAASIPMEGPALGIDLALYGPVTAILNPPQPGLLERLFGRSRTSPNPILDRRADVIAAMSATVTQRDRLLRRISTTTAAKERADRAVQMLDRVAEQATRLSRELATRRDRSPAFDDAADKATRRLADLRTQQAVTQQQIAAMVQDMEFSRTVADALARIASALSAAIKTAEAAAIVGKTDLRALGHGNQPLTIDEAGAAVAQAIDDLAARMIENRRAERIAASAAVDLARATQSS